MYIYKSYILSYFLFIYLSVCSNFSEFLFLLHAYFPTGCIYSFAVRCFASNGFSEGNWNSVVQLEQYLSQSTSSGYWSGNCMLEQCCIRLSKFLVMFGVIFGCFCACFVSVKFLLFCVTLTFFL